MWSFGMLKDNKCCINDNTLQRNKQDTHEKRNKQHTHEKRNKQHTHERRNKQHTHEKLEDLLLVIDPDVFVIIYT